jgi:outer membrane protein OmpA-like peptidoglycan-associated protein
VVTVLAMVAAAAASCGPLGWPGGRDAEPDQVIASVDAAPPDPRSYDPAHPPVPLTAVETGGGRVELAGLWRQGPFVRLALAAESSTDGFTARGRFGPLFREMGAMLLVDPARRAVHPVLTPPGAAGATSCLCSPSLLTARRGALYYADFHVPEDVTDVLVLGDSTPPFGRVLIATAPPDLAGAGYSWPGGEPPPPGSVSFDAGATVAALVDPGWPRPAEPAAETLPADLLFGLGSAELSDDARSRIGDLAEHLRGLPGGAAVAVVGHTDSRGGVAANLRLAERRAEAVAAELRDRLGRGDLTVTAEGRGEDEPLAPDTDEAGEPLPDNQARNRRVDVQVPAPFAGHRDEARPAPPADAPPSTPAAGEVAATEVVPDPQAGDRIHVGIERVTAEPALGLLRVDLRLGLAGTDRRVRRSLLGDEALAGAGAPYGNGTRDLRLVDLDRHVSVSPVADALDHCLCPDDIGQTLLLGSSERFSVWFPKPPDGTSAVNLLVPRAGLLRSIAVT